MWTYVCFCLVLCGTLALFSYSKIKVFHCSVLGGLYWDCILGPAVSVSDIQFCPPGRKVLLIFQNWISSHFFDTTMNLFAAMMYENPKFFFVVWFCVILCSCHQTPWTVTARPLMVSQRFYPQWRHKLTVVILNQTPTQQNCYLICGYVNGTVSHFAVLHYTQQKERLKIKQINIIFVPLIARLQIGVVLHKTHVLVFSCYRQLSSRWSSYA